MTPRGRCVKAELEPGSPLLHYPRFSGSLAPAASLGTSSAGLIEPSLHTNHLREKKRLFFFFSFFSLFIKNRIYGTGAEMAVRVYGWRDVCVCGPLVHNPCYQSSEKCQVLGEDLIRLELPLKNTKIKYESIMHSIIANGMQMGLGPSRLNQELGQSP